MSTITDSTTTLDTSWTEQTIAIFTAGVLSDLDACIDEVEAKLQRGTLSTSTTPTLAQAKNWLRRAKLEIAEKKDFGFTRKYVSGTLTANAYRYALPPDYRGGEISIRDTTNDRFIAVWPRARFDLKFPDPSEETSDEVLAACIKNMELWFSPPPLAADTIEMEYPRSGAETTADDFDWLPEKERFLCCDYAIAEAFEALHMWGESDRYRMKYIDGLRSSIRADGRRKWKSKRNQIINVFQEYNLRRYQPGRYS
jgi:hypothetical protein